MINKHGSVSQIIEFIIDFLDLEIDIIDKRIKYPDLQRKHQTIDSKVSAVDSYKWTDNKSDLIEVLQAIVLLGSINEGKVKKNDFIVFIGKQLNVNLQNHNGLLNDILNRFDNPDDKYSRIYYLKRMIDALQQKLEALDKKQIRK